VKLLIASLGIAAGVVLIVAGFRSSVTGDDEQNLPDNIERGREISAWTVPYYVSFALLAAFLLFNLFIGIVINSLEEARAIELSRMQQDDADPHDRVLAERVRELRRIVDELERDIAARGP